MRLAAPLIGLVFLGACAAPRCQNRIAGREAAPDAAHDAVVYHRSCGADDGASTGVAIVPHDADLPDVPTTVLALSDSVHVSTRWLAPGELELTYPAGTRVVTQMTTSPEGIAIRVTPEKHAP